VEKSAGICDALAHLRRRLGAMAFDVLDYWPGDPDIIGIAPPKAEEPRVCILTAGKDSGRFCSAATPMECPSIQRISATFLTRRRP
jgi:hypothetical protein